MKILVTGASGFLGGHIAEDCLTQSDETRVLVRQTSNIEHLKKMQGIEFCYGDLSDKQALIRAFTGVEVVIHSAARAALWGTRADFYKANYEGTINVIEACLFAGVRRLVYVSSPNAIFDFKEHIDIDETYPYPEHPVNYYSETKGLAERAVIRANGTNGLETVSLRPHAIWGPGDRIGFFPHLVAKIASGKFRTVGKDREVLVDLCYVKNASSACLLAARANNAKGRIYFVTDGQTISIWPFMSEVIDFLGLPKPIGDISPEKAMKFAGIIEKIWQLPWLEKHYEPPLTKSTVALLTCSGSYNINAAKNDLGYSPLVNVKDGLGHLKCWIEEIGGIREFVKYV